MVEAGPAAGGQRLVLDADVRAPGRVRLTLTLVPSGSDTRVDLEIGFSPAGVLGAAYLLTDLPARELVTDLAFRSLLAELLR